MLTFWTSAGAQAIRKTIGAALSRMKPAPEHRFVAFGGTLHEAATGELVVACGTKMLEAMWQAGIAPKNRSIKSLRGRVFAAPGGGHYMVTFDPVLVELEPGKASDIDWDVRLAARFHRTGSLEPVLGDYRWVDGFEDLIVAIKCKYRKTGAPVDVSFDTETMGFHPWYPDKRIVAAGFAMEEGRADAMHFTGRQLTPRQREQISWLLTTPMVSLRCANGKYDMLWVSVTWGIACANFRFDTALAGSLTDENRSNSLNIHCKIYAGDLGGYDDAWNQAHDKGHMEAIPKDDLLPYMGGDIDATLRVASVLKRELLEDARLARFYVKVLHPAARAFEKVERRGVLVDTERYAKLKKDLEDDIEANTGRVFSLMPRRLRLKYADNLNLSRSAVLRDFFFSPLGLNLKPLMLTGKTGEPSTAKAHLQMFADHPAATWAVDLLARINSAEKTLGTYVNGFVKHLRPDGRFHGSYMLHHGGFNDGDDEAGTVSGRLSCKEPALQTIPKKTGWAGRLRECFIAPPGKVLFSCDYNQGELRVVACVADERNMIDAYRRGMDLHAVTGARLGGYEFEEFLRLKAADKDLYDRLRTRAKAGNFGLLYGMMARGFIAYAWASYKLRLTEEEAERIIAGFFGLYPGLKGYHDQMRGFVRRHGHVRSPLGRVRHLPSIWSRDRSVASRAERQAINSPIQSTLTDMMIWAMALIEETLDTSQIEIVGMTHDNIYGYVPVENADVHIARIQEVMSNLPFHELGWAPALEFPADAEAGFDLGRLGKVEDLMKDAA